MKNLYVCFKRGNREITGSYLDKHGNKKYQYGPHHEIAMYIPFFVYIHLLHNAHVQGDYVNFEYEGKSHKFNYKTEAWWQELKDGEEPTVPATIAPLKEAGYIASPEQALLEQGPVGGNTILEQARRVMAEEAEAKRIAAELEAKRSQGNTSTQKVANSAKTAVKKAPAVKKGATKKAKKAPAVKKTAKPVEKAVG